MNLYYALEREYQSIEKLLYGNIYGLHWFNVTIGLNILGEGLIENIIAIGS